ncbi:hypothetical protein ACFL56_03535 [Candidatus Margulisiibacteriota bacterium]
MSLSIVPIPSLGGREIYCRSNSNYDLGLSSPFLTNPHIDYILNDEPDDEPDDEETDEKFYFEPQYLELDISLSSCGTMRGTRGDSLLPQSSDLNLSPRIFSDTLYHEGSVDVSFPIEFAPWFSFRPQAIGSYYYMWDPGSQSDFNDRGIFTYEVSFGLNFTVEPIHLQISAIPFFAQAYGASIGDTFYRETFLGVDGVVAWSVSDTFSELPFSLNLVGSGGYRKFGLTNYSRYLRASSGYYFAIGSEMNFGRVRKADNLMFGLGYSRSNDSVPTYYDIVADTVYLSTSFDLIRSEEKKPISFRGLVEYDFATSYGDECTDTITGSIGTDLGGLFNNNSVLGLDLYYAWTHNMWWVHQSTHSLGLQASLSFRFLDEDGQGG